MMKVGRCIPQMWGFVWGCKDGVGKRAAALANYCFSGWLLNGLRVFVA